MTTFTVWKFDDPQGAERAESILEYAAADGLVKIVDHAVVTWPKGAAEPKTDHKHDERRRGTGWGAFWGLVVGTLFLVPVVGAAAGASIGAISKATEGTGIRREDLEKIRTSVTEGSSALFLVTENAELDRLGERFHGMPKQLLTTNLTDAEKEVLMETFGGSQ
jgi:uncharacterized membrane protein